MNKKLFWVSKNIFRLPEKIEFLKADEMAL